MPKSDQHCMPNNLTVVKIPHWYRRIMIGLNISLALIPATCVIVNIALGITTFVIFTLLSVVWLWVLTYGHQSEWIVKLAAKITGCAAIEIMDLHSGSLKTVACLADNHSGWAHVFWLSGVGSMRLLSNGVVDKDSESSYLYLWRYLDRVVQTEHTLSWNTPDWHECQKMDHFEKITWRAHMQG